MVRLSDLIHGEPDSPGDGRDQNPAGAEAQKIACPKPIQLRSLAGSATHTEQPAEPLTDWYGRAQAVLRPVVDAVRAGGDWALGDLPMIATAIVSSLARDDRLFITAVSSRTDADQVRNLVHVSIFAVKIGMGMGIRRDDLGRLALAGLVHDFGMYRLPAHVLDDPGQWAADQVVQMRTHPSSGAEVLRRGAPEYPWLPDIVIQEHERASGTGYPRGLKGYQIHELAHIIGLADVFDALLTPRPYRRRRHPHEAIREILTVEKAAFSPQVLKAMVQQFSMFPVGSTVRLNTGEIAVVAKANAKYPLRPQVRLGPGSDAERGSAESKIVDLSTTTLMHIVEAVPEDGMTGVGSGGAP